MSNETRTRAEHLAWCKARALDLVEAGDLTQAFASMVSDLGKHMATVGHIGIALGSQLLYAGQLDSPSKMRHWIDGFN